MTNLLRAPYLQCFYYILMIDTWLGWGMRYNTRLPSNEWGRDGTLQYIANLWFSSSLYKFCWYFADCNKLTEQKPNILIGRAGEGHHWLNKSYVEIEGPSIEFQVVWIPLSRVRDLSSVTSTYVDILTRETMRQWQLGNNLMSKITDWFVILRVRKLKMKMMYNISLVTVLLCITEIIW